VPLENRQLDGSMRAGRSVWSDPALRCLQVLPGALSLQGEGPSGD
jgi:hypothetical protein